MERDTIGVVVALAGLALFLYSFKLESIERIVYLVVGLVMIIGGLVYAKK